MRAPRSAKTVHPDRFVQRWAAVVLAITLLYVIFGIPGDDRTDASQTDRVSPLNSWIWLTLLVMAMPVLQQRWREVLQLLKGSWALLALFLYFALSVTWALDPAASQRRWAFSFLQIVLFAILLSGIRRAAILHVIIAAVCGVGGVANLAAWMISPGSAMADDGFAGLQGQKNQAGLLFMYGCLATVPCIFLVAGRVWKAALAASTSVMAVLLVATRSSTSESVVVSAIFVMPMVLAMAQLKRRVILALSFGTILALTTAMLLYLAWTGVSGTDPMLPLRGVTFSARTDIWSFVVGEIVKRPWLGAGYESFWAINPDLQPSLKTYQWFGVYTIINEAHEGYLDLLATGGVVGLVGGLFVLFRTIAIAGPAIRGAAPARQAWKDGELARPTALFHLALLLGLIVHNFTESNLFSNNSVLAVAFLLTILDLEKWRLHRQLLASEVPAMGTGWRHREARSMVRPLNYSVRGRSDLR